MNKTNGHVYLVSNKLYPENVFKLGMSKNIEQRLRSYGKDRKVHRLTEVPDCALMEKKLLSVFSEKFEVFRGKETFKGELDKMLKIFDQVCSPKKERQWKKYLPNWKETWTGKGTDKRPTLESITRKPNAHIDLRYFPLHLEGYIKGNEKVVIIAAHCDSMQIHRIGALCFLKSDTLGMAARSVNPKFATIVDLGHADVHFVVLEKNLPGDWVFCVARNWDECIAFRGKYYGGTDKKELLTPRGHGDNFWQNVECFGEDTEADEGLYEMMGRGHVFIFKDVTETVTRYLVNDLTDCYCAWMRNFSMELFTRDRRRTEFLTSPREPLSSIKRALHTMEVQRIISKMARPSTKFQYGVEVFGADLEIFPETEEQLESYAKWGKNFNSDDGYSYNYEFPDFILSLCVYAVFSWDWDCDVGGGVEIPGLPVNFDEPNPWSLEKTKKHTDIHDINHKFPGNVLLFHSREALIDIIVHCKDGPIYIVLFDPMKNKPIGEEYTMPPMKNFARAIHFVDITKISSEYLCSVFRGETNV